MSEDLSKLLSGMLANPEAIKNLFSSAAGSAPAVQKNESPTLPDISHALNQVDDKRIALLTALKPYLSTNRSTNVDKAIQLLKLTKLTESLRNEGK